MNTVNFKKRYIEVAFLCSEFLKIPPGALLTPEFTTVNIDSQKQYLQSGTDDSITNLKNP